MSAPERKVLSPNQREYNCSDSCTKKTEPTRVVGGKSKEKM